MKTIKEQLLTGERALFKSEYLQLSNCIFADGESPLKESKHITLTDSVFKWKYPLWYCEEIEMNNTTLLETARSGIWYTHHIQVKNSVMDAPKSFRRSSDIYLNHVHLPNATETLWNCQNIVMKDVQAHGDYFAMNSENIIVDQMNLSGNYSFDGAKNIEIRNSTLLSKDAFWNCENVIVYDSTILGEYIGWNSKDVTFVNCTIESLQGFCYMDNVKLINCKLINTTLAFEYSTVDAQITTAIAGVKNPISGRIVAPHIQELIMEEDMIDVHATCFDLAENMLTQG